jgi:hypothetical protein
MSFLKNLSLKLEERKKYEGGQGGTAENEL